MAFTLAAVDGWTFTLLTSIKPVDETATLASFELRGECRHGT